MRRTSPLFVVLLLLASCPEPEVIVAIDGDGDGWTESLDCDDDVAAIFPGAQEVCDLVDNDCDGLVDEDAIDSVIWYGDADVDGHGTDQFVVFACEAPPGYVGTSDDCNDLEPLTFPGADELCDGADNDCDGTVDEDDAIDAYTWYLDEDGDGYGQDSETWLACDAPPFYSAHAGDCDDEDPAFHPGASESDCTDPNDYNCDGAVGFADGDGDGFTACEDCDDADEDVHPDGVETCDGVDNDCNGLLDDDATDASTWYADADGDSYAGATLTLVACDAPAGYQAAATDCDDLDPTSFPGGTEVCDGADNDCDTDVDEGLGQPWFADLDGDGYGDPDNTTTACDAPLDYVANDDDCDDGEATASPASFEICDGIDNDCDGVADEAGAIGGSTFWVDGDGDDYGDPDQPTTEACDAPTGYADNDDDCDDALTPVNPGVLEICADAIDNDCDGLINEDDATDAITWYYDGDLDGFGVPSPTTDACVVPFGYTDNTDDCDDTAASSTTLAAAADCDGIVTAEDCNDDDPDSNSIDEDGDCDGALTADDCDDADDASTIVAEDGDCDGTLTADDCDDADDTSTIVATDGDCDEYITAADCDDTDPLVNPGMPEIAGDGIDNDCDGIIDNSAFSGAIEMPAAGTVDGFSSGPWQSMNPGGRVATRVVLTQDCVNPQLAFYQHPTADTSIYGNYYVMDATEAVLDDSGFATYSGCNDCWLPHSGRLSLTMSAGQTYWLAFNNGPSSGDMSGPSIYNDANARTVGIATFDAPRADDPNTNTLSLPASAVSWQQRWRLDCE